MRRYWQERRRGSRANPAAPRPSARRDSRIYSANCKRMGGKSVVIKVYDKTKISAVKHRSVKREARIMKYLTQKK